jgi:hypothetical protein
VAPIRAADALLNVSESCSWWSLSGPHSVIRCVLLPAFGTFWMGEGLGLTWPGVNWSILGLIAGFLCGTDRCANCPGVTCNTKPRHIARCRMKWIKTIFAGLIGPFIDHGSFAIAIVVWLGLGWFVLPHVPLPHVWQAPVLFAGLLAILLESVLGAARRR